MKKQSFKTEAELVEAFIASIERTNERVADRPDSPKHWIVYPETAGYDLLLVQKATGVQIAVEAKLSFNLKVLNQILPGRHDIGWTRPSQGPDYRAVLVPTGGLERGLGQIAGLLGITVLSVHNMHYDPYQGEPDPYPGYRRSKPEWMIRPDLPDETCKDQHLYGDYWHPWCPEQRCALPAYVPDVAAGVASPVILSPWKINAIKLMIILDRRGYVTRADMRHLGLSPTIWTSATGYLGSGAKRGQYVGCKHTPDFRKQHPRVWGEIEADLAIWGEGLDIAGDGLSASPGHPAPDGQLNLK